MINMLATICLLAPFLPLQAQESLRDEPASRVKYHNRTSTGILLGGQEGQVMGNLITVHGIAFGHLAIGVGTGIEGYERWRMIPLFGSASLHFRPHNESGVFLQFNAGHSFGKLLMEDEGLYIEGDKGGPMINPMIGYQISTEKLILFLAAGYKRQSVEGTYMSIWSTRYTIEEKADRFLFQIGFGFR